MSNCIELYPSTAKVLFLPHEIDGVALKAKLDTIPAENPAGEGKDSKYWWFLNHQNVKFQDNGSVQIHFGRARSSHTWRDFRYTINQLLNPYMKSKKFHRFVAGDEYDGFESRFYINVTFGEEFSE